MGKLDFFASPGPWIYGAERDDRTDTDKLKDAALDVIIANATRVQAEASGREFDLQLAQSRFDACEAEFVRLIEDQTLVPYDTLASAFALTSWNQRS